MDLPPTQGEEDVAQQNTAPLRGTFGIKAHDDQACLLGELEALPQPARQGHRLAGDAQVAPWNAPLLEQRLGDLGGGLGRNRGTDSPRGLRSVDAEQPPGGVYEGPA